jgi:hypothetical protein
MLKNLQVISILCLLVACGSDDSGNNGIDLDSLKGRAPTPTITETTAENGDAIGINSKITSTILNGSDIEFSLLAGRDAFVAVCLTDTADNLYLHISGGAVDKRGTNINSKKMIIFKAEAFQVYSLGITSSNYEGQFDLKVVEATRVTLGLKDNELLSRLAFNGTYYCGDGRKSMFSYESFLVINFVDGYWGVLGTTPTESFATVDDNNFTLNASGQQFGNEYSYVTSLALNPSNGAIVGTDKRKDSYLDNDACESTSSFEGQILL